MLKKIAEAASGLVTGLVFMAIIAVPLGAIVGVIYIVSHFIGKYW